MKPSESGNISRKTRAIAIGFASAVALAVWSAMALGHEVKDLKYGAVLFEFYQQKYFETLVEYDYAGERGGIHNHGNYPELLKGGVSLSYGLDLQAKEIFTKLIAENTPEEVQNRAWFYLAKMLYLRGDTERAATTLSNIHGAMPHDIDQEYRYLAALINIKMGYFEEAESISRSFEKDSPYAPYLYFNLGVAFGKEKDYTRAVANLKKSASYTDGSNVLDRLADRSHMATAYLYAEDQNLANAYTQIKLVSATGVFSNRALLGSGWASVNSGSYQEALGPLTVLQQRSMAIPEVQEAVLLVPHVYEKLGLAGRAAEGFISAYDRYGDELAQLNRARETLKNANVLELFVRNLDEMLGESDWFGTAPSVSLNSLSPFLLDRISDHSFQSVIKDLRDLYAIRNNLNSWKRKQDDFDVIIKSRSASLDVKRRNQNISTSSGQQAVLQNRYSALTLRAAALGKEDQERVQWLLSDIQFEINSAGMMVKQLHDGPGVSMNTDGYALLVKNNMDVLEKDLEKTNELIDKVENVLRELVNAELDIHEERLKYYRVQAHLAKARILDHSLTALDDPAASDHVGIPVNRKLAAPSDEHKADSKGGGDAP
jgi:tetratricopeptide (TPR) repeat protein